MPASPSISIIDRSGGGAVTVSFGIDQRALQSVMDMLSPGQYRVAAQGAASETAVHVRKEITNRLQDELNARDRDIKKAITIKKGSYTQPEATVLVSRYPIPLSAFDPKQTVRSANGGFRHLGKTSKGNPLGVRFSKRGARNVGELTVKVRKHGSREQIRSAFLYRGRVLSRRDGGKISRRYPIRAQFGPTAVGVTANKPGLLEGVMETGQAFYTKAFLGKVDWILSGNPQAAKLVERAERIS